MANEDLGLRFNELPNIGVLSAQVPAEMLKILNSEISTLIDSDFKSQSEYNQNLLGHMKHEYNLSNCISLLEPFVLYLTNMYDQKWQWLGRAVEIYTQNSPKILKLTDLWVNIQQKHEFNPPHEHTGVMSFVIWMKIPYDLTEEEKFFPPVSGDANRTSKFTFHYSNLLGQHSHYMVEVDKSHEGTICIFPSKLNHSVNPFYTSDGYRISISGNIRMIDR
jgi:hypothetical protein